MLRSYCARNETTGVSCGRPPTILFMAGAATPILILSAAIAAGAPAASPAAKPSREMTVQDAAENPSGVWVVSFMDVEEAGRIPSMSDNALAKSLGLEKQHIAGIAPRIPWSVVNPLRGEFDWAVMDRILKLARSRGKKVAVRISAAATADSTPSWVWDRVGWWPTRGKRKGSRPDKLRTPKVWDPRFVEARAELVRAMAARFDTEPAVQRVVLDDFALDNEMDYLREDRLSAATWKEIMAHGYYAEEIVRNWQDLIELYAESFRHKPLFLNLTRVVIPLGKEKKLALDWMIETIASHAQEKLGKRLYLQFNGLSESMPMAEKACENPNLDLLVTFHRRFQTTIGFQTVALGAAKTKDLGKAFEIARTYPVAYVEVMRDFWRAEREKTGQAVERFVRPATAK